MTIVDPTQAASPWHDGERAIQQRVGVAERMEVFGRKVIRSFMPDQHRAFYAQLPFVLAGAVDNAGRPWATIVEGSPGFMHSPDPQTLVIGARRAGADPALAGLHAGAAIGLLGIELHTRRRNRLNGTVSTLSDERFAVRVGHAFGNCPQYIQTRGFEFARPPGLSPTGKAERLSGLDAAAAAVITAADTFFVASYVDVGGDPAQRQIDVSHRGGKAGFVRVNGNTLTIPDFAGNLHFNTLGNLLTNPRAGLLFIDFASGDLLHLSGCTELLFDGPEIGAFQGAERLWRVHVEHLVRRPDALALRWRFAEFSPNSLMTGSWEAAQARQRADALSLSWRPLRVTRIVAESSSIKSFHLEPTDGAGVPLFQAGQHLPIRLHTGAAAPLSRTYTISSAPSDAGLRISVKREGAASRWLHDEVKVGDQIEARAPAGGFTIDARVRRPAVLLSAGVGITPMLAMLRHLIYEGQRTRGMRPTVFVHGARTLAERPFDRELVQLAAVAGRSLAIVRVLSRPEDSAALGVDYDHRGHIDVALLKDVLGFDDYDFYLCGPASFMQSLYDGLRALNVADARIHAEAFGPSTLQRRPDPGAITAPSAPAATAPVQVIFTKSAKEARWSPGDGNLLELAEARGLTPEYSCRAGSCGSCRTAVIEGKVAYAQSPVAPTDAGSALICCAVPAAGDRLLLDL